MDIYDEIKNNLKKLKVLDNCKEIFGAYNHKYKMNPILTNRQVSKFENLHGISLPQDYKGFLLTVGNGGAGPYYGMFSLIEFFTSRHYDIEIVKDFLSTPFPFSLDNLYPNDVEDETDEILIKEMTGTITLSHQGCGYFDMLIVSGKEKGTVWSDGRCSDQGMMKINNSFLEWYCEWLNGSVKKLRK